MHEFRPFERSQRQEEIRDAAPAKVFGKASPTVRDAALALQPGLAGNGLCEVGGKLEVDFAPWRP